MVENRIAGPALGVLLPVAVAVLTGCASLAPAVPASSQAAAPTTLVSQSGLVIGTLSYQYVDRAGGQGEPWRVHFERIDVPANRQEYALDVSVDASAQAGVFTGALPAGVYAFRDAGNTAHRFSSGRLPMPFEVQAGEVRDVGHFAVGPTAR